MRRPIFLASLLFLMPLAACSTPDLNQITQTCPGLAILAQAAEVTKTRLGGVTRDDVIFSAEMLPAMMACDYAFGDSDVTVDLRVPIIVRRGPAASEPQSLNYFIAVIDPNGTMVSKRIFARNILADDVPVGTVTEFINGTTIGLAQNRQPFEYQVLLGFQLSADEYVRNQADPLFRSCIRCSLN